MLNKIIAGTAVACLMTTSVASADEVWQVVNSEQTIVYEQDLEGTDIAVFKYGNVRLYIDGLAGVYENRRTFYRGVWLADEDSRYDDIPEYSCLTELKRPGSEETRQVWGPVALTFVKRDFPSMIALRTGSCFSEGDSAVVAEPVLGGE